MSGIPASHLPLIESFLGPEALPTSQRGPEALLGLPTGSHDVAAVFAALQQRLAFVNAHPRGGSPEADVVRLCLQAAASQLLSPPPPVLLPPVPVRVPARRDVPADDPSAPVTLASEIPGSPGPIPTRAASEPPIPLEPQPVSAPPAPERRASNPVPNKAAGNPVPRGLAPNDPLVREAARLIAIEGGVSAGVVKHVAMLAMARGLPAEAVQSVLAQLAGPAQTTAPASARPVPGPHVAKASVGGFPPAKPEKPEEMRPRSLFEPDAEEIDPGTRLLKTAALVAGGIFIASIGLIIGGAVMLSNVPAPPAQPAAAPAPVAQAQPEPVPARVAEDAVGEIPDANAVIRLVRKASEVASSQPDEALDRFEKAAPVFAAWWPRMDTGQRAAAVSAVIDLALRVTVNPERADRFVTIIASGSAAFSAKSPIPPQRVFEVAWSVGMLARLASEQNLPSRTRLRVQASAAAALGGVRLPGSSSFNTGASIGLRAMPLLLLGDGATADPAGAAAAFERWEQAVRALFGPGAAEQAYAEGMVVDGLERVVVTAPEPDENRTVYEVLTSMASRLRWRDGDPSRRKLVAWFDDPRVSNADLATLTAAIVSRSAAEGVDLTMVLPRSASGEQRRQLGDAYAAAWGLLLAPGSGPADSWREVARAELALSAPSDPLEALRAAAVFARLNEVAWRRYRGDAQGAADVMVHEVAAIRRAAPTPQGVSYVLALGGPSTGDGVWALRYLSNDRSLPSRVDRLRELQNRADVGPIDADLLAEIALLGGGEVRTVALGLLPLFRTSPAMANAVLKFLPRAPRSRELASAIRSLTSRTIGPWNGEHWRLLFRRAVLEHLLELLAADSATAGVDQAAAIMAPAYQAAAKIEPSPGGIGADEGGQAARDAAAVLFRVLHEDAIRLSPNDAAPMPLDRIDRRHGARLAVASGPVQQFVADQIGCAELLSYIVTAERPGKSREAKIVLDDLHAGHREASDIRHQIRLAEAAMLRLWFLRLGEPAP